MQPLGASACEDTIGSDPVHRIRGQPPLPGAEGRTEDAQRARLNAQIAARNSLIQRSLDDHAERVARKARSGDGSVRETAEARMNALRRRVAARGAASSSNGAQGDDLRRLDLPRLVGGAEAGNEQRGVMAANHDVAHSATRAAHHAVLGPPAGDARQLRDR